MSQGAGASPGSAGADPYIGRTLDKRYRIDRLIGRGGMGAVYEAHHIGLDRKVAVKFVLGGDADAIARFRREAQAASKIDHDHVVHIYDVGTDETGADFIAMELVEGVDLKKALEAGLFDTARAIHVAKQLVAGLAAVHDAGIVHRDIKPANIMLTDHDDDPDFVKIMDFGISKTLDRSGASITLAGRVVGTPAYMAPEQLLGEDADPRSDLYAAALVIYEMLSGAPPLRAENTDLLIEQRLGEHPKRLDEVNPAVPVALARVIDRALDKVPGQRYPNADALLAALDIQIASPGSAGTRSTPEGSAESIDTSRLDSRTVAARPAPSEQPTAQLTPPTAIDRPRRSGGVAVPPPVVTAQREVTPTARATWPLVLAALLVVGVPLGVFLVMRGRTKAPAATPPPPPIAVVADASVVVVSESAQLLAQARDAERAGKSTEALAAYRRYLEVDPNAPDATHVVERIAALAPPAPPQPPQPTQVARKPARPLKSCICAVDGTRLCKATAPLCRCESARQPLCPVKPQARCDERYSLPLWKQSQLCSGYTTWASHTETRGMIACHFCPGETELFRGHEGDPCTGYSAMTGDPVKGTLRGCF